MENTTTMKDPRIKKIFSQIERIAGGKFNGKTTPSGKGDELDGIIVGLNMLSEEIRRREEEGIKFRKEHDAYEKQLKRKVAEIERSNRKLEKSQQALVKVQDDLVKEKKLLLEKEEKFRSIFSSSNDAIFITQNGIIVETNERSLEMFEVPEKDKMVGKPIFNFFPPRQPDGSNSKKTALDLIGKVLKGKNQLFYWKHRTFTKKDFDTEVSVSKFKVGKEVFVQGVIRDISERFEIEERIKQNEIKFRSIFENSEDIIIMLDRKLNMTEINKVLFGFTKEQTIGSSVFDWFTSKDEKAVARKVLNSALREEKAGEYQVSIIDPENGEVHWFLSSVNPQVIDGRVESITILSKEITELKRNEVKLAESENLLRNTISNIDEIVYEVSFVKGKNNKIDPNRAEVEFLSPVVKDKLGYPAEVFKENPELWFSLIHPEDIPGVLADTARMVEERKGLTRLYRLKGKLDKEYEYFEDQIVPRFGKNNTVTGFWGSARNISRRVEIQSKLRESEERLALALKASNTGIFDLDVVNNKVYWDAWMHKITGLSPKSRKDRNEHFFSVVHPEDLERTLGNFQMHLTPGAETTEFGDEFRMKVKGEDPKHVVTDGIIFRDDKGNPLRVVGALKDVTANKLAEEQLRESEERYRSIFQYSDDTILIIDKNGYILEMNRADPEFELTDVIGTNLFDWILDEDQKKNAIQVIANAFKNHTSGSYQTSVTFPSGEVRYHMSAVSPIRKDNKVEMVTIVSRDITPIKESEMKVLESEERYRSIFEYSDDLIMIADNNGVITNMNKVDEGYEISQIIGTSLYDWFSDEEELATGKEAIQGAVEESKSGRYQITTIDPFGKTRLHSVAVSPIINEGKTEGITAIARDITAIKEAERRIKESEERYRTLFNNAPVGIAVADFAGHMKAFNNSIIQMGGWTEEEIQNGVNAIDYYVDPKDRKELIKEVKNNGHAEPRELEFKHKDGSRYWVMSTGQMIQWEGEPHMMTIIEDITERKKSREDLEEYKKYFSISMDMICIADENGHLTKVNSAFEKNLGWDLDKMKSKPFTDFVHPDDMESTMAEFSQALEGRPIISFENRYVGKDGTFKHLEWNAFPDPENKLVYAAARDISAQKIAETALKESEQINRSIVSALAEGIILYDSDMKMITCNHSAQQILGLSYEQLEKDGISDRKWKTITEDSTPYSVENLPAIRTLKDGVSIMDEVIGIVKPGGKTIWLSINTEPIYAGDSKNPTAVVTSFNDITEEREALRLQKDSQQKLEVVFDNVKEMLNLMEYKPNNNHEIVAVNKAFLNLSGMTEKQAIGSRVHDFFPPDEAKYVIKQYQKAAQSREIQHDIKEFRIGDRTFTFEADLVPIFEEDKIKYLLNVSRDVTAHVEAENQLREGAKALSESQRIGNLGSYEWDIVNDSASISDNFYTMMYLDRKKKVFTHDDFESWVHKDDLPQAREEFQRCMDTKEPFEITFRVYRGDGKMIYIQERAELETDDKGKPIRLRGTYQDITDLHKIQEEIQELNEQLENRVKERTTSLQVAKDELESFSYSVSHDLRAPLRAITGYSRLLIEDYLSAMDEEGSRMLNIIKSEAQRMGVLIDDLLDFSRIGRAEMETFDCDVSKIVNDVYKELVVYNHERNVDFVTKDLPGVVADGPMLKQVFTNLISNALKYRRERGVCEIVINGKRHSNETVFCVEDNGVGFDMKYYKKLFGVFQRLHSEERFPGTGIGLALVKRIVTKHGGRVWAESTVNKGSKFYIALPN